MSDIGIELNPLPDPFARLPALAERLGVVPLAAGFRGSVVLRTQDGTSYDLFDLVDAILDRIDATTK